jgi:predicted nucleotidyltransferase
MTWRKSSRSGSGGDCVEVRGDLEAVRDSKAPGVVMPVSRDAVNRFIATLRLAGGRP